MVLSSATTGRVTPFNKAAACLTLLCFLSSQNSWAYGPSNASTGQTELASAGISSLEPSNLGVSGLGDIEIPESIGKIKSVFQGDKDKIFIHIQDAHISESAQLNIAKILEIFADRYGMKRVHVEGAEGTVYPQFLSFFPDRSVRKSISDFLLHEGRLSGPEYLAVVEQKNIQLEGIEEGNLYQANREAYLEAAKVAQSDLQLLESVGKLLQNLPRFIFSEELLALYQSRSRFRDGGNELIPYVKALIKTAEKHSIPLKGYYELDSFQKLIALEKEIDFEAASEQIEQLTQDLKHVVSRQRLSQFLTNTVQFRMNKMRRSEYYGYLRREIDLIDADGSPAGSRVPLKTQYDSVLKYLQYMQLYDQIGVTLFDELDRLESEVKGKIFQKQEERDLDQLLAIYDIYHQLFSFELTKKDAEYFYSHRSEFTAELFQKRMQPFLEKFHFAEALPAGLGALDQDLPRVEKFYELALQRDKILIQNAIRSAEADSHNVTALVTGGFHTPGIERYLREHGYSYMVLTPSLAGDSNQANEKEIYARAMAQKPIPLEEVLIPESNQAKSARIQDPRFQLSPHTSLPTSSNLPIFMAELLGRNTRAKVRENLKETTPTFLAIPLGELLTVKESGGVQKARERIQAEIVQHPEWPESVREALSQWTLSSSSVYIHDEQKGTHSLYFRMDGIDGPQFYLLFIGPSAFEFRESAGIRQTRQDMRISIDLNGSNIIVWAAAIKHPDLLPPAVAQSLFKGAEITVSEKRAEVRQLAEIPQHRRPQGSKPAANRDVARRIPTPAPLIGREAAAKKIEIPPTLPEEPQPVKITIHPEQKPRAEIRKVIQPVLQTPSIQPVSGDFLRGGREVLRRTAAAYARESEVHGWAGPGLLLTLHSEGNLDGYLRREQQKMKLLQARMEQILDQTRQNGSRVSHQAGASFLSLGSEMVQRNEGSIRSGLYALGSISFSESYRSVDRWASHWFWGLDRIWKERVAQVKSRWTHDNYVAVTESRRKIAPMTPAQKQITEGIGSARSMDMEDILRATGLSDSRFPHLEQNIANATRKIILEAAGPSMMDHAKDAPGVLIYEWDMNLGYAVQMRFLRDLLYIHNTQQSQIRIILPFENPDSERIEAWMDRDLSMEDWTGYVIMRSPLGQVLQEILEKNQGLDLVQMTGLPKILAGFSDKRTKGIQGLSYGLASLIPGQILILSESPLAQTNRSLNISAVLNIYSILQSWASDHAAEIAA